MLNLLRKLDARFKIRARLEDSFLTLPNPFFVKPLNPDWDQVDVVRILNELQEGGAVVLKDFISSEMAAAIRKSFSESLAHKSPETIVECDELTGSLCIRSDLRPAGELATVAADPRICWIAESYFRRRAFLADLDIRRDPPVDMAEVERKSVEAALGYSANHWHRDQRGRQVKMLVYLTEVGPLDNNFAFVPGSHIGMHRRTDFVESRISENSVRSCSKPPVEAYGAAGTAVVFDTNVIHRLRRRPQADTRDTVTFYYTPGQSLRKIAGAATARATIPHSNILSGRR